MQRRSYELWYALGAIAIITAVYLWVLTRMGAAPAASDLLGHSLGILGFILMLMTETLYSLRKRSRRARWGRMANWLQFHIFTGLVGPYMVLLHSSWKFNGLAGVVTFLMGVVVLSGIIGRYIYTAVPRTVDGAMMASEALTAQIAAAEQRLQAMLTASPAMAGQRLVELPALPHSQVSLILGRSFQEWAYRLQWWWEKQRMGASARSQAREMDRLLRERRILSRQLASLAVARRMLAVWHAIHIPIGMALFAAASVHIGAAIYYATLLR